MDHCDPNQRLSSQELYQQIAPGLYSWARLRLLRVGLEDIDPGDVVQEVWVRVLDRFEDCPREPKRFRAWVFGVAVNVCSEWFRKACRRRTGSSPGSAMEQLPEEVTSFTRRLRKRIASNQLIEGLFSWVEAEASLFERDLLLYRGLQGLAHKDIARLLGRSEQTIKNRWSQLRQKLGSLLPPELVEQYLHG